MPAPGKGFDRVEIRRENAQDHRRVFEVNAQAFETNAEAELVEALRPAARPMISLVATLEGRVVGHILFTPVTVEKAPGSTVAMALGPMAVLPEFQRRGIGSMLVRAGLRECDAIGADVVFVLGHAEYYPRFGFELAAPLGLRYKSEDFDPYFMVLELQPGLLKSISGYVSYLPDFEQG